VHRLLFWCHHESEPPRPGPAQVERVLAFHIGLPKPSWLGADYYQDTVVTMDVDSQRQAAYDAQTVSG
jgi:hypothetical protein